MLEASATTELLIIDQSPLLEEALDSCERARERINRYKAQLQRFDAVDLPAYERWYNSSFGKYITEIRELGAFTYEREKVLAATKKRHWAKFFGSTCAVHAELGIGQTGTQWEEDEAVGAGFSTHEQQPKDTDEEGEYGPEHEDFRFAEDGIFDDEQGSHYSEDDDSVRWFEDLFIKGDQWRSQGFHQSRRSRPGDGEHEKGQTRESPEWNEDTKVPESLEDRLKNRYRLLVKKLHPDMNGGLSDEERTLWNHVQVAYRSKNLEQLDVLLALSQVFSGRLEHGASIHQVRRATQEIERLLEPLKRKIDAARKRRAWNFAALPNRSHLFKLIEAEFIRDLMAIRKTLAQVEAQIARFTKLTAE